MLRQCVLSAELVKDGMSKDEIEINGYGAAGLVVPTANDVREPQNRRVEIVLK